MGNTCIKHAATAAQPNNAAGSVASNGIAREFLEDIGLGIYVVAFEVSGFDSHGALQCLTHWDLDSIQNQSHIPILPTHRDKILEASRNYVAPVKHFHPEQHDQQQPPPATTDQENSSEPAGNAAQQQQQQEKNKEKEEDAAGEPAASSRAITQPLLKRWFSGAKQQQQQPSQHLVPAQPSEESQGALPAGAAVAAANEENPAHGTACRHVASGSAAVQQPTYSSTTEQVAGSDTTPVEPEAAAAAAAAGATFGGSTTALLEAKATVAAADEAVSRLIRKLQQVCPKAWRAPEASDIEPMYDHLLAIQEQQEEGEQQQEEEERKGCGTGVTTAAAAAAAAVDGQAPVEEQQLASKSGGEAANCNAAAGNDGATAEGTLPAATAAAAPGPLIANKTILQKSLNNSNRLPPMMPRKPPNAWQEMAGEVTKLSYAPLATHPLPPPSSATAAKLAADLHSSRQKEAPSAAGAWAELPNELASLSYAATAPISGNALHASSTTAGIAGKQQQQQHQQHGPLVAESVHLPTRHCTDPGYQQQQHQSSAPNSARASSAAAGGSAAVAAAAKAAAATTNNTGTSSNLALANLPSSVQQLHEQVMTRLRAQGGSSNVGSAAVAASISDIYKGTAWAAGEQQGLLGAALPHQEDSQQVICRLVKQVANSPVGGSSSNNSSRTGGIANSSSIATPVNAAAAGVRASSAKRLPAAPAVQYSTTAHNSDQLPAHHSAAAGAGFADLVVASSATGHQEAAGRSSMRLDLSRCSLTSNGSLLTVGSIAGSIAGERPLSSRSGSRAADVSMIVHRAKERAAARQRGQGPWTPRSLIDDEQQQQQQQQQQQPVALPGMVGEGSQVLLPLPGQPSGGAGSSRCLSEESSSTSFAAVVGMQEGERAMRMLQDYRTISDLDAAIHARVSQLASAQPDAPPAAAGRAAGRAAAVWSGSGTAAAAGSGLKDVAKRQAAGSAAWRTAASRSPEADTAARPDCGPQQQQQQQQAAVCQLVVDAGHAGDAAVVAVGLLGIQEALDNSYDAGKPSQPAGRHQGSSAVTDLHSSSSSSRGVDATDRYRNPFVSPVTSPTPPVQLPGVVQSGYEAQQQQQQQQQQQRQRWGQASRVALSGAAENGSGLARMASGSAAPSGCAQRKSASCGGASSSSNTDAGGSNWHTYTAAVPAVAMASKGAASAAAAARNVDERIKRIVLASRARTAAAAAAGTAGGELGGAAGIMVSHVV